MQLRLIRKGGKKKKGKKEEDKFKPHTTVSAETDAHAMSLSEND